MSKTNLATLKVYLEDIGVYCDKILDDDITIRDFYIKEGKRKYLIGELSWLNDQRYQYSLYGKPETNKKIINLITELMSFEVQELIVNYYRDEPFLIREDY